MVWIQFFFTLTGCFNKDREHILPNYLPIPKWGKYTQAFFPNDIWAKWNVWWSIFIYDQKIINWYLDSYEFENN